MAPYSNVMLVASKKAFSDAQEAGNNVMEHSTLPSESSCRYDNAHPCFQGTVGISQRMMPYYGADRVDNMNHWILQPFNLSIGMLYNYEMSMFEGLDASVIYLL